MSDPRDKLAKDFLELAKELVDAAKHAEIAAKHFVNKEIPRACAHAAAVEGHIEASQQLLREFYLLHRKFARVQD
jgi:hypothetical protein